MAGTGNSGKFVSNQTQEPPSGSVLYEEHLKLTDKSHIADFAGYLMPLWYSSISAEHSAVRRTAGLFDCTHMGALEVIGPTTAEFLNAVTTNEVNNLSPGGAQYSYILDAGGDVLDDIIIYKRAENKFIMVVNAANEPKIKVWLKRLINDKIVIDIDKPSRKLECKAVIRDMRDTSSGSDCRVDIALQGPASINILSALVNEEVQNRIENLIPFHFAEAVVADVECIISRTGYTGSKIGFELFVHPENAPQLWRRLLQNGESFGLLACGLGARDSLRIEAGLPLYGYELAGPFSISPFEAGYGWAVKLEKDFFIGKAAVQARAKTYDMKVVRVELPGEKGIRPVRQNDATLDDTGECRGWVLSCAKTGEKQFALCFMNRAVKENDAVGIYYLARSQSQIANGRKEQIEKNAVTDADIVGRVVSRFAKF